MENPFVVLVALIDAFDKLKIDYVVVGSVASSLHGEYRASGDIDIIADIKVSHISGIIELLHHDFYLDELAIRRAIEHGRSFNVIHLEAVFKADIFIPVTELARQQLKRREQHELGSIPDQRVWVASAEDTILAKLVWYRRGNETSELQWRDLRGIIGTREGSLDLVYLKHWSERLGVADLLERALSESG